MLISKADKLRTILLIFLYKTVDWQFYLLSAINFSASRAAMQPIPALVTAWR